MNLPGGAARSMSQGLRVWYKTSSAQIGTGALIVLTMMTVLTISDFRIFNEEMRHNPITLRTRVARSCRYG
jgi:hypothetical protein